MAHPSPSGSQGMGSNQNPQILVIDTSYKSQNARETEIGPATVNYGSSDQSSQPPSVEDPPPNVSWLEFAQSYMSKLLKEEEAQRGGEMDVQAC
jgi:hypothetical protein